MRINIRAMLMALGQLLLAGGALAEPKHETVHLLVGDVKVVKAPEAAELEVSKRGVLQIEEDSPGSWRLTALARGFVVLSFKESELVKRVHVFVMSPTPNSSLQSFCQKGIRCVGDDFIRGETASFEDWLEALGYCRSKKSCLFDVTLIGDGLQACLEKAGRAFGQGMKLDYVAPNKLLVKRICLDAANQERKPLFSKTPGHWLNLMAIEEVCEMNDLDVYHVSASVVLVSRDTAEQLGLDVVRQPISFKAAGLPLEPKLLDQLSANNMAILAQPSVRLRVGQTAKIASGGEFKVMFAGDRSEQNVREGWKRYGIELQFTIRQAAKDLLQVTTELSLSSPQGAGLDSLQSHKIASDLILPLREKQLVGMADLYSQSEGELQRSTLSRLPILGPLFNVRSKSDGQRVLMYWLTAESL